MESTWAEDYKKVKEREERFQTAPVLELNDPEEKIKQKSRMERFEVPRDKEVDYWEKYMEPSGDIRKDTLYLYGVDYLNTKKILEYFNYFSPGKVEWLNDTSCNVVFPSDDNALEALNTNCIEKINPEAFENIKRPALGYRLNDEVMPMYIRFSTIGDVKSEETIAKNSKYYKWAKTERNIKNKAISRNRNKKRVE